MSLIRKIDQADRAFHRLTRSRERELIQAFQDSLKEIRGELSAGYERYGVEMSNWQKYNRLANLEREIGEIIRILTGKNARNLKKGIGDAFQDSYYRTAFALETEVQAKLGYGLLNEKVIEEAVSNPMDRIGWPERNRHNQRLMNRQIREEITRGLIQGKPYQEVAESIKKRMDIGASKAVTIVRTEAHRAQQAGRQHSMEQAESTGVKMVKVWTSSLDDRTREDHEEMDGVKVGVSEEFELPDGSMAEAPGLTGEPEQDINCRCSTRPEIVGYESEFRRARGEGIIPYQTYNEWKENRIDV